MVRFLLAPVLSLVLAAPVSAQDAPQDWDFIDQQGIRAAGVRFDSGLSVVVRCQDEGLETYIVGLPADPEAETKRRTIDYAFGDSALRPSTWQVSESGTSIFADVPAALARRFRTGGELQLRLAGREGRPAQRYVVTLPASASSIDRVLTACNRPLTDPRDELRRDEASRAPDEGGSRPTWERVPQAAYPSAALRRGLSGMAVLSCLAGEDGHVGDCQIEVERPMGAGFGASALRAASEGRLNDAGEAAAAASGGLISFTIQFRTR